MAASTPREQALGTLLIDLDGPALTPEERELLLHPLVGGAVLFARNYADPEQLRALCAAIHGLRRPPLAVAVDQEGGAVQRFRDGFARLPSLRALGRRYDRERERAYRACSLAGWLMAAELRAVGVDLSFAPVVDLHDRRSEVIGRHERAFHAEPYAVRDLASRYIAGMHRAGMKSVRKHFPGHGRVREDSHVARPVDARSFRELLGEDLVPFAQLDAARDEGVMTAHIVFPQVDDAPVTFSHRWLQHVLRDRLGFEGAVFSDDLSMQAARLHADVAADVAAAFRAGCDVALLCNNRAGVHEVLDRLGEYRNPVASLRLWRLRAAPGAPSLAELRRSGPWREAAVEAEAHVIRREFGA